MNDINCVISGEKCTPGDPKGCGDGGQAKEAKLTFPKGVAVSIDRTIYITDGKRNTSSQKTFRFL